MKVVTFSLTGWRRHWRLLLAAALGLAALWPLAARHRPASARGGHAPGVVWYVDLPPDRRVIALTFDDGPSPYTPRILELLQHYHQQATFFVLGQNAARYPQYVRAEAQAGMEVADHTYSHLNLARHSAATDEADLRRAQDLLTRLTGRTPVLLRPPYGTYNRDLLEVARRLGLHVVMWSWTEDSRDWTRPGVGTIVQRVLAHLEPGDIVLMHDGGGDRSQTVEALAIILRDLAAGGWRSVTVSELLRMAPAPGPAS
ncbi:Chitooligosaccharide deacetylase [Candidatus Hydrogenisulfobacillus filiaventi]|uniref:Chitooligosaccharide deacetylase n=1 Tax=Candidatus Hydrogenisulfobacillus filiaventi TaxID=2707344 RepID=A0A6F8ZH65_9FIRM|nr:polysaccharide deacetylase family protein [Bacillota bacterium]CAB1129126.1 Chitooligosaccharide deacetylase [Candidatus Hydrogenisulfobacillus filiaventi]